MNKTWKDRQCSNVMKLPKSERCEFVINESNCYNDDESGIYFKIAFCDTLFNKNSELYAILLFLFMMFGLFVVIAVLADEIMCPCALSIASLLNFSDNLAGVTILALGNGLPDIFNAMAAQASHHSEIFFGGIMGSGLFVTTLVAGAVVLITPFTVDPFATLRDILFLGTAAAILSQAFLRRQVTYVIPILFACLYALYITIVMGVPLLLKTIRKRRATQLPPMDEDMNEKELEEFALTKGKILPPEQSTQKKVVALESNMTKLAEYTERQHILKTLGRSPSKFKSKEKQGFIHKIRAWETEEKGTCRKCCHSFAVHVIDLCIDFQDKFLPQIKTMTIIQVYLLSVILPTQIILKLVVPSVNTVLEDGGWCKLQMMINLLFFPMVMLFFTNQITRHIAGVPVWPFVLLLGAGSSMIIGFTTRISFPPRGHKVFAIFGFFGSGVIIRGLTSVIVDLLRVMGAILGVTNGTMSLTVMAIGNSLGDLVSNMSIAKRGLSRMAFAASFGGPLFNCIWGTTFAWVVEILRGNTTYPVICEATVVPITTFYFINLASIVVFLLTLRFEIRRSVAVYMITLYALFLLYIVLIEFRYMTDYGGVLNELENYAKPTSIL